MVLSGDHHTIVELGKRLRFPNTDFIWNVKSQAILSGDSKDEEKLKVAKVYKELNRHFSFDFQKPVEYSEAGQTETVTNIPNSLKEEDYSLVSYLKSRYGDSYENK